MPLLFCLSEYVFYASHSRDFCEAIISCPRQTLPHRPHPASPTGIMIGMMSAAFTYNNPSQVSVNDTIDHHFLPLLGALVTESTTSPCQCIIISNVHHSSLASQAAHPIFSTLQSSMRPASPFTPSRVIRDARLYSRAEATS